MSPPWFEPHVPRSPTIPKSLRTIKRDNKLLVSQSLPSFSSTNIRSIKSKLYSYSNDLLENEISCGLIQEIWQKEDDEDLEEGIEEIFQTKGLIYISNPRHVSKRGGGVAIVANTADVTVEKLDIIIPHNLEIVWALIKPRMSSLFKVIIVASFYLPPKSRKKTKMFDHISQTVQLLLCKHIGAGILVGADRNEFDIDPLLNIAPRMKQIVTLPTRGNNILSVLITNMSQYYSTPIINPPVCPDKDYTRHKPSDHSVPVVYPLNGSSGSLKLHSYKVKKYRPMPKSGIDSFGQWITKENWNFLCDITDPHTQVIKFQDCLQFKLNLHLPEKSVRISENDLPFFTSELKTLDRQKKREYRKNKKSQK